MKKNIYLVYFGGNIDIPSLMHLQGTLLNCSVTLLTQGNGPDAFFLFHLLYNKEYAF